MSRVGCAAGLPVPQVLVCTRGIIQRKRLDPPSHKATEDRRVRYRRINIEATGSCYADGNTLL